MKTIKISNNLGDSIEFRKVATSMLISLNQPGTVYEITSSVDDESGKCHIEQGVCIELYTATKEDIKNKIWPKLKSRFDLECAHITVPDNFAGCIYDYVRESSCPLKQRRAQTQEHNK